MHGPWKWSFVAKKRTHLSRVERYRKPVCLSLGMFCVCIYLRWNVLNSDTFLSKVLVGNGANGQWVVCCEQALKCCDGWSTLQAVPHHLKKITVSVSSFLCKVAVFEGGSFGRLAQDSCNDMLKREMPPTSPNWIGLSLEWLVRNRPQLCFS